VTSNMNDRVLWAIEVLLQPPPPPTNHNASSSKSNLSVPDAQPSPKPVFGMRLPPAALMRNRSVEPPANSSSSNSLPNHPPRLLPSVSEPIHSSPKESPPASPLPIKENAHKVRGNITTKNKVEMFSNISVTLPYNSVCFLADKYFMLHDIGLLHFLIDYLPLSLVSQSSLVGCICRRTLVNGKDYCLNMCHMILH
jgi:hypothetical protein